jgi:hypothetical protein
MCLTLQCCEQAKGITVDTFIAKWLHGELWCFSDFEIKYIWKLSGSASRRPSEIVEKILHTLNEREKELRRKNLTQSWVTTLSFRGAAIPARFRIMDPQRKTFESIVEQVSPPVLIFQNLSKVLPSP